MWWRCSERDPLRLPNTADARQRACIACHRPNHRCDTSRHIRDENGGSRLAGEASARSRRVALALAALLAFGRPPHRHDLGLDLAARRVEGVGEGCLSAREQPAVAIERRRRRRVAEALGPGGRSRLSRSRATRRCGGGHASGARPLPPGGHRHCWASGDGPVDGFAVLVGEPAPQAPLGYGRARPLTAGTNTRRGNCS